jgi:hypothetical protein
LKLHVRSPKPYLLKVQKSICCRSNQVTDLKNHQAEAPGQRICVSQAL